MDTQPGPGPCYFVIFGATGNLVTKKLLPSLYHLDELGRLGDDLRFLAMGHEPRSTDDWHNHVRDVLSKNGDDSSDSTTLNRFVSRFDYLSGDLTDLATYQGMMEELSKPRMGTCDNFVFYLAIPPGLFDDVICKLDEVGINRQSGRHNIVIEKPFGHDIETAENLNRILHQHFNEDQIFRIDHYLGKETVQNLLVFRFANTLIEPIWNRNYIDHVQITVAESLGTGGRAGYYDKAGAMRDMLQNHLMQLLTVVAMEPPATMDADALRDEKVKVLRSIRPIPRDAVSSYAMRGQYTAGQIDGNGVPGYLDEEGVPANSTTETFVAAKFYIDNWRWRDVPFYLRTGKRLKEGMSTIALRFKQPPQQLFRETPVQDIEPNWIVLEIQPEDVMFMELQAKQPGLGMSTRKVKLDASYRGGDTNLLDAYSMLLLDVVEGDKSLFIRYDEVEWAWRVVDPIIRHWAQNTDFILGYPAGSWGPPEASRLFDREDQSWRNEI